MLFRDSCETRSGSLIFMGASVSDNQRPLFLRTRMTVFENMNAKLNDNLTVMPKLTGLAR